MQQRGAHEARDDGVEPETHRAYGASVEDMSSILVRNVFASAKIPPVVALSLPSKLSVRVMETTPLSIFP